MTSIILTVLATTIAGILATGQPDPAMHGGLRFDPVILHARPDSGGFIQYMLKAYSDHGDTIRVTSITGSCKCATASVQRPVAHDTVPAKMYLAINTNHIEDSVAYIDFAITTNTVPTSYRVVVHKNITK